MKRGEEEAITKDSLLQPWLCIKAKSTGTDTRQDEEKRQQKEGKILWLVGVGSCSFGLCQLS